MLVGYAVFVAIAGRRTYMRRRRAAPIALATRGVARLVEGGTPEPAERSAFESLPIQVQMRLLADLTTNLVGDPRVRLAELAVETGVVAAAERLCRHRRAVRRLRGVRVLTKIGVGRPLVRRLVRDRDPDVRAAAATWAADHADMALATSVVMMLDDERPLCRFAAKDALLRMGSTAVEPLLWRLTSRPGGRVDEALEVAAGLADYALLDAALAAADDGAPARRLLAAQLCTAIGGADATSALEDMLTDADGSVRAAAAAGLGQLGHWPAAPQLADALMDPSWDVRRAAALALRGLGSPGRLFLRDALDGEDRFAADMARQVLTLPGQRVPA